MLRSTISEKAKTHIAALLQTSVEDLLAKLTRQSEEWENKYALVVDMGPEAQVLCEPRNAALMVRLSCSLTLKVLPLATFIDGAGPE